MSSYEEKISAIRRNKICDYQKKLSDALVEIKRLEKENEELKRRVEFLSQYGLSD